MDCVDLVMRFVCARKMRFADHNGFLVLVRLRWGESGHPHLLGVLLDNTTLYCGDTILIDRIPAGLT